MKISLFKKIWWLWRYYYLQKKAVYENTFIGDFPEPEPEPKSVIVSAPAPTKKGGSGRLRLRLRNTGY